MVAIGSVHYVRGGIFTRRKFLFFCFFREKSIRTGSFFYRSKLPLGKLLTSFVGQLVYKHMLKRSFLVFQTMCRAMEFDLRDVFGIIDTKHVFVTLNLLRTEVLKL